MNSFNLGIFGVVLFFLISGFVIPFSLYNGAGLKRFFISRFFRLYPVFWVAVLLNVWIGPFIGREDFTFIQIFANLTMVPRVWGQDMIDGVYWTLFVELIFYFICSIFFILKCLDRPFILAGAAIGLSLITPAAILLNLYCGKVILLQYFSFHLSFLFLGAVIRFAFFNQNKTAKNLLYICLAVSFITIPISTGFYTSLPIQLSGKITTYDASGLVSGYFSALIVFLYVIKVKKFNSCIWSFVGKISYSLYLIHWLCCLIILKLLSINSQFDQVLFIIGGLVTSIFISWILYFYIERFGMRVGKRVNAYLG